MTATAIEGPIAETLRCYWDLILFALVAGCIFYYVIFGRRKP